jgi:nucleoside-diphosphate-sugar epimerase
MKRILVTGATGFIGQHCLSLLLEKGFEVHAVSSKPHSPEKGISWIQIDLLDKDGIRECLSRVRPTHLLHLAWNATPGKFWHARDNIAWLEASIALLEAFAAEGGERVVVAGTCAEYDWNYEELSESNTPCQPHTLYGSCKLALHLILNALASQMKFSHAWGRIFYLYGPHESPQRFIPAIITGLLNQNPVPCSHGNQIRDFMHVEDVARAFVTLVDSKVQGTINIGSGKGVCLKEVIAKITTRLGSKELIQWGAFPSPANDPPRLIADNRRLQTELNWEPKYTLETGLDHTINWWKEMRQK